MNLCGCCPAQVHTAGVDRGPLSGGGRYRGAVTIAARAEGLTKTYGSGSAVVTALDGVDFQVHQGDFTAMYDRLVNSAEGIRAIAEQYDATVRKNMV